MVRGQTRNMIYKNNLTLTPRHKLVLGLLFIPAYLLQQSLLIRSIQLFILITLYILQGGKFRILPNFMLVSGIVLAYIVRPAGKILFMLLDFPVTRGALISGLSRSLMLIGLIYLSRLSVSSKLKFKGTPGNLIGRVFYYFEAITEGPGKLKISKFNKSGILDSLIEYIDNLLISVEKESNQKEIKKVYINEKSSKGIQILIFTFILICYILILPIIKIK